MLLFIVASVNIGIYITPAFPAMNSTQFSTKPSILQKPLLVFYCVSTVSNNCVPVHLRKRWCQSHVDLKEIYTYVFVTLLKKKTNAPKKGRNTRCCLDARKKPQGNIQGMKFEGEMRRNLQFIAWVRIIPLFPRFFWVNGWVKFWSQ